MVYPILYNGTTYAPVRAVSSIFGEKVGWDGDTKTVYLGEKESGLNLANAMGAGTEYCYKISDSSGLTVDTASGSKTFKSGIERKIWNGNISSSKFTLTPINVTGKTKVTFSVWSDIDADILLLDENGGVITSFVNTAGTISQKEIDITGYSRIAFGANSSEVLGIPKGTVKFFDPVAR